MARLSCPCVQDEGKWGVKFKIHSFLTSAKDGSKWPVSYIGRFTIGENSGNKLSRKHDGYIQT